MREGADVTVLAYGTMVYVALAAAEETGIDAEVIDLRTLLPVDIDTIVASVEKTGRCVIVHEATRTCGYGAELSALVQENCFHHLEAPIERVTGWDTPYPHAFEWEYFPGPEARRRGDAPRDGGLSDGHVRFQAARCRRRHRRGRNRRLACEGRRRGQRRSEPGRRDDRQGDGGNDLAGHRQGRVAARRAGRDGAGRRRRWSNSKSKAPAT